MKKSSTVSRILIGTSGWHYAEWNNTFYPPEIKGYNQLTFFAKQFPTVENNSSFYQMPKAINLKKWDDATPEQFTISVKLTKSLTHFRRLNADKESASLLKTFLEEVQILKTKLGVLLIQLPGSFKSDIERLKEFLELCKVEIPKYTYQPPIAFEFRHESWFEDKIFHLLKSYNAALVIAQSSRYPCHQVLTADFGYYRFHGPKKLFASSYSLKELTAWAKFMKSAQHQTKRAYVYFNNTFQQDAIKNARTLRLLLDKHEI